MHHRGMRYSFHRQWRRRSPPSRMWASAVDLSFRPTGHANNNDREHIMPVPDMTTRSHYRYQSLTRYRPIATTIRRACADATSTAACRDRRCKIVNRKRYM